MPRNTLLHAPARSEPASFAGSIADLVSGIAIMFFVIGAAAILAGTV